MSELKRFKEQHKYQLENKCIVAVEIDELQALLDYITGLEKDNKALKEELMFACEFDAYTTVDKDRYDFAIDFMDKAGRDEPSFEDEVNGLRRLIQMAMEHSKHET